MQARNRLKHFNKLVARTQAHPGNLALQL